MYWKSRGNAFMSMNVPPLFREPKWLGIPCSHSLHMQDENNDWIASGKLHQQMCRSERGSNLQPKYPFLKQRTFSLFKLKMWSSDEVERCLWLRDFWISANKENSEQKDGTCVAQGTTAAVLFHGLTLGDSSCDRMIVDTEGATPKSLLPAIPSPTWNS